MSVDFKPVLILSCWQEKLFSGSHNVVHIWDATGSFGLRGTIDHSLGSVYSLAVTRQFIIVGKFFRCFFVSLFRFTFEVRIFRDT